MVNAHCGQEFEDVLAAAKRLRTTFYLHSLISTKVSHVDVARCHVSRKSVSKNIRIEVCPGPGKKMRPGQTYDSRSHRVPCSRSERKCCRVLLPLMFGEIVLRVPAIRYSTINRSRRHLAGDDTTPTAIEHDSTIALMIRHCRTESPGILRRPTGENPA